jgi:glycosyltransferase involved in cell wall biosynthesis
MNTPRLSIIVPTHGARDGIDELLKSITRQASPPEYEVLVVANRADPHLREKLRDYGETFKYFETGKIGANRARNLGIEAARADVLLFLDDDCRLHRPDFLRRHYSSHEAHPSIDAFGGPYELAEPASTWDRAYHHAQQSWLFAGSRLSAKMDPLVGGNLSFKRTSLGQNRFDPELVYGGTETELLARLAAAGASARLLPDLSVEHRTCLGPHDLIRKAFFQGAGAARITAIHRPRVFMTRTSQNPAGKLFDLAFQAGYRAGAPNGKRIGFYFVKELVLALNGSLVPAILKDWVNLLQASEVASDKTRKNRRSPPMND